MINFQRIIDEYKKSKKEILECIVSDFYSAKKECLDEKKSSLFKFEICAYDLGRFTTNMEKDLEEEIPLLRESKKKVRCAKRQRLKQNIAVAIDNLREAEKCFLKFKEEEFERNLTIALSNHLKRVKK